MIRDRNDLNWHIRLWKISLKNRDECHPATSLWVIFDVQSARIKKRIDDFIGSNPEHGDLLKEASKAELVAADSDKQREQAYVKKSIKSNKSRQKSKQNKKAAKS
jgi:hypothetical protein